MTAPEVTVLSFGGGQDSTALLGLLVNDEEFRQRYAPNRLVVVMADTGDEHPGTLLHVGRVKEFCARRGVEFHHLTSDKGFHSEAWRDLRHQYRRNKTVGSKVYLKTCTWNLKILPIYRWMESWLGQNYGVVVGRKRGFYEFVDRFGPVRVLLGIAAGEEKRVSGDRSMEPVWMQRCIEKDYPLIELGWDRQACQDYIRGLGQVVPPPSNCMLCPFMSEVELLWLARHYPADFDEWVGLERDKVEEYARRGVPVEKNFGVWGRKMLPAKLLDAEAKHGHMSNEELQEYKMSHGHCVASRY